MAQKKELPVQIIDKSGNQETGHFILQEFDSSDRTLRAIKMLVMMWLMAGITLFIPLAHFVLVPGFLIAGPVMAWSRYKMERCSEQLTGTCPACRKPLVKKVEAKDYPPVWTYCNECRDPLQIKEP